MRFRPVSAAMIAATLCLSLSAHAATVGWTDWTSATTGANGSAAGTLVFGSTSVAVTYTGDVTFAQLGSGTNYFNPATAYLNGPVTNAPPAAEMIALSRNTGQALNTITFSQPVSNPVMAIVSLGQSSLPVYYSFNAPFDVISVGQGYWGNGTLTELAGNVLEGKEGHGLIQFNGTFSSISWSVSPSEYWHGITVGAEGVAIPLPGAAWAGLGLMGAVAVRKLRRR